MRALLAATVVLAACGEEESYIIVSVDKRPAVHDAETLRVTLSNADEKLTKDLAIDDAMFPMTFSLSAPGRSGELTVSVDALDVMETLVGRGEGTTNLDEMMASVVIDTADFVVNTELALDQYLTTDFEAVGFQLAAINNGQWTATYRDECTMCNVFARRFDATGLPVFSQEAAGDIGFPISTTTTTNAAMPAVASSVDKTIVLWDFTENTGSPAARGIACRPLDATGAAPATQTTIAPGDATDVVSATGLSNGNFAVVWQIFVSGTPSYYAARTAIVRPDCGIVANPANASTDTTAGAQRPHVASNGSTLLYSWITDGALRVRTASLIGAFTGTEQTLIPATSAQEIEHARVSAWGTGFALAVRWTDAMSTDGPGKIEVYRLSSTGMLVGGPILITDKSRSDFASNKGFSIAQRPDGALLVVWHVCEAGPGLCDVFGRILRPTGAPVGDEFVIPTSTASEQINPSVIALQDSFVAAWNDSSGEAPDRSGTAVRARILYPVYDDARGIHGATCGASSPGAPACGEGLACAMGSDGVQRCYAQCTPPSCPGGGTCTTVDETTSACTF